MHHSNFAPDVYSNLTRRTFEYQNRIPLSDSVLWKIEQGAVRTLTWNREGTAATLGLWGPGDVVGKPLSKADPYEIKCLQCVTAVALPADLWAQELNAIILYAQQIEELIKIVNNEIVHTRLLEFLIWLSYKFGYSVNQGQLIKLQLTHQEIAESIATTRVTVTRMLGILEKEGKIIRNHRQLILPHDRVVSNDSQRQSQ
jgi:CRP-like cAMP-binding protein